MAASQQDILVAKLLADVSGFKKGMDAATEKANKTASKLSKSFDKVGKAMKIGLAVGLAALSYNAVNTIKNFEQGVANLAAVTGQTTKEIEGLTNNALKLGAATAYTAGEVTGLQTELAKLGFRERDIINLTKPILNLAQATGTDLANAASLAGSVVQSFGLDAKETTSVVDIMTKSFSASALDIRKFEVGIRQVAPVAKNANVSISEVTSMLGVLANNGVRAETAGVGLRNILLEAAKRGVPFAELLEQINSSADKSATAMDLFGKENAAVGVILSESTKKVSELNAALLDSAGTAQEMADKQLDTLSGSITLLTSAWDGFILSIEKGDGAIGNLTRNTLGTFTRALQTLTNLSNYMETVNPFKSINEYSKETLDLILDIGRSAESGEDYAKILAPLNAEIESMDFSAIMSNINDIQKTFNQALREQGDDFETIDVLWKRYKERIIDVASSSRFEDKTEEVNAAIVEQTNVVDKAAESIRQYAVAMTSLNRVSSATVQSSKDVNNSLKPVGEQIDVAKYKTEAYNEEQLRLAQQSNMVAMGLQSAFTTMGNTIVDSLGLAENGMQGFLKVALKTALQVVSMALSQSMAQSIVNATQTAASTGPAAAFTQPAFIATALAGIGTAFSSIPKFAEGGVVGGSSMTGDKILARLNSKELVLTQQHQNNLVGMMDNNGSGSSERLVTRLQGNDILVAVERATNTRKRKRGF